MTISVSQTTPYLVYDVFTEAPFGGNQLAVFTDARNIPEAHLQSIAAEFNFSEVTFIYPPDNPDHTARVRIFTPTSEIPFAGHPTIGTIYALAGLGHRSPMTLELGVGPLKCGLDESGAKFTTEAELEILSRPEPALVARCLGLEARQIKETTHGPVQASLGLPFVVCELTDRAALTACQTDIAAIRQAAQKYPTRLDFAIFAYFRQDHIIHSRMFAPLDNITEDPATGSASATLAALLAQIHGAPQNLTFHQGEDMGRPSIIHARAIAAPLSVTLSGKAVQTMSGEFILPT